MRPCADLPRLCLRPRGIPAGRARRGEGLRRRSGPGCTGPDRSGRALKDPGPGRADILRSVRGPAGDRAAKVRPPWQDGFRVRPSSCHDRPHLQVTQRAPIRGGRSRRFPTRKTGKGADASTARGPDVLQAVDRIRCLSQAWLEARVCPPAEQRRSIAVHSAGRLSLFLQDVRKLLQRRS